MTVSGSHTAVVHGLARAAVAAAVAFALALSVAGCGESDDRKIKGLKVQVQQAHGEKEFAKELKLAQQGLTLARDVKGDTNYDTLYFAQAVSEAQIALRNWSGAERALEQELALRTKAKHTEEKLQRRRTMLIKLAEESGNTDTAIAQTVIIAKAISMGQGKDPQPTYRAETVYPPDLYSARTEGDVEMAYSLTPEGTPTGVRVLRAVPPNVFNAAALESFKKWRFTPFIENGQPVSSTGHRFTLAFLLGANARGR